MMSNAQPAAGLKFRATLADADKTRERPVTIYGNSLEEIQRWAQEVLKTATEPAGVLVYQTMEAAGSHHHQAKGGTETVTPLAALVKELQQEGRIVHALEAAPRSVPQNIRETPRPRPRGVLVPHPTGPGQIKCDCGKQTCKTCWKRERAAARQRGEDKLPTGRAPSCGRCETCDRCIRNAKARDKWQRDRMNRQPAAGSTPPPRKGASQGRSSSNRDEADGACNRLKESA